MNKKEFNIKNKRKLYLLDKKYCTDKGLGKNQELELIKLISDTKLYLETELKLRRIEDKEFKIANKKRLDLIDKKFSNKKLSEKEEIELKYTNEVVGKYLNKRHPLPIAKLKRTMKKLGLKY